MKILLVGMTPENDKIDVQLSVDNVIEFSPLKGGGHVADVKDEETIKRLLKVGGREYKGSAKAATVEEKADVNVEVDAEVSPAEAVAKTAEKAKKPAAKKDAKKKNSKPPRNK